MKKCPHCGGDISKYSNPFPTADVIIYHPERGIVLIRRKNPPLGIALPGGFIEEGETCEQAARREMMEETGLDVRLQGILGVYSAPDRDPRFHTMTVTYVGTAEHPETLRAGDDAGGAAFCPLDEIPAQLCFDHARAVGHFRDWLAGKRPLLPCAE